MMSNYKMAPFFWEKQKSDILLTNDAGRFLYITSNDFQEFIEGALTKESIVLESLIEEGFAFVETDIKFLDEWAMEVRMSKSCHFTATQLFILVLTSACNQSCVYCQASAGSDNNYMTIETARKSIDIAFTSPAESITIEFQGGEPTLNPSVLYASVLYAKELQEKTGKNLLMALVTNLTNADDYLIGWLLDHKVDICSSLDGPEYVHNKNRPMNNFNNTYVSYFEGVKKYQNACMQRSIDPTIKAIQTTTRYSLDYGIQIVDEYRNLGSDSIYIRPLTPLGYAAKNWKDIGYTTDQYLSYYRSIVDYIISIERNGTPIKEVTASILLHRILLHEAVSHTEHRSPCGGAIGQMAINYDGDIYTCDEARMLGTSGDKAFRIGNVDDTYIKLISSPVVHALCTASCLEGLPMCCDCVYQPFCSTCPVVTYGFEKDIFSHQLETYHCKISKGILEYLFALIRGADAQTMEILMRWAQ